MTDVNMDKVIDRITKLLSLANNNPNEAEAESAMRKAQGLLEAYNLDMSQIGGNGPGHSRKDAKRTGGLYTWQRKLWKSVAEMNFCYYLSIKGLQRGSQYEHRLVGSHANVVATELMAQYLQDTVEKLAQKWAKEHGYKSVFVRDAIAYREGMTSRVTERLQAKRDKMVRDAELERKKRDEAAAAGASASNSLTIVDVISTEADFNNDYLNGYELGTTARRRHEAQLRQEASAREFEARTAAYNEKIATDPAFAAAEKERITKLDEENKKWYEQYLKKQARRESRGVNPRPRAQTAEEKRMDLDSFWHGRADGEAVGIDTQVDETKKRAIK